MKLFDYLTKSMQPLCDHDLDALGFLFLKSEGDEFFLDETIDNIFYFTEEITSALLINKLSRNHYVFDSKIVAKVNALKRIDGATRGKVSIPHNYIDSCEWVPLRDFTKTAYYFNENNKEVESGNFMFFAQHAGLYPLFDSEIRAIENQIITQMNKKVGLRIKLEDAESLINTLVKRRDEIIKGEL